MEPTPKVEKRRPDYFGSKRSACRAVSRFLYPCRRQSFIWAAHYWTALATYPRVKRSGPLLLSYLVLLRVGFALPVGLLRLRCALTAPFHPYLVRGGIFSVALSVKSALSGSPRPFAGTLPYGDRTLLPRFQERLPARQAKPIMAPSRVSMRLKLSRYILISLRTF
jgi:hypothetical protein